MIPPEEKCEIQDLGTERNFFTLIPNIVFHFKLDPWAFKAYCVIKMTAGDNGSCFKSNSRMAEEIGCSIPTLIKLKNDLVEEGLILIHKRTHPNGGNMPDLIQIVNIWGQNMEYMLKLYPKDPKNDHFMMGGERKKSLTGGGKPNLGRGVNAVNQGSKPGLHKEDIKEEDVKKTTATASAAASFYKELKDIDIPVADKIEITKNYPIESVRHALLWLQKNDKPLTKGVAAALKWACKVQPAIPEPKKAEKIPVNPEGYNKTYYREINTVASQNGVRLHNHGIRDICEYVETETAKIYFKDRSFLEQLANCLRKKSVECRNIFDMIKACQNDLVKQLC